MVGYAVALPPRPRPLPKNRIRANAEPAGAGYGTNAGRRGLSRCVGMIIPQPRPAFKKNSIIAASKRKRPGVDI